MDAVLAEEIRAALGEPAPWTEPALRLGETWLLLADRAGCRGEARRWRSVGHPAVDSLGRELDSLIGNAWLGFAASLGKLHCGLPVNFRKGTFEVPGMAVGTSVEGASLGVSAALAWLSRAANRPVPASLAASAELTRDGTLLPVRFLERKLAALAKAAPAVHRILVAADQKLDETIDVRFQIVRCRTFAEVISEAGMTLDELPARSIEALEARVRTFKQENSSLHGSAEWRALSIEAWAAAEALAEEPSASEDAARARSWAALFALHAGDDATARALSASLHGSTDPSVRLWSCVVSCAGLIDAPDFEVDAVVANLDAALGECRPLPTDHAWIEGHALGTRARALLHGVRLADSLAAHRSAAEWFRKRMMPWEAARSLLGGATSQRMHSAVGAALETLAEVDTLMVAAGGRRAELRKTREFVALERGRCLLALGRAQEATSEFAQIQGGDGDYPRLGALRGLARSLRRTGRLAEADEMFATCLRVSAAASPGGILGRVAVMAVAEAIEDESGAFRTGESEWRRHFGASDPVARLATFVY
ncbi:MAG: hypothetical protein Q8M65_01040 [Rhodoglobus sp.]|nr:hypothetical protein [Rhodoglobus sp.]